MTYGWAILIVIIVAGVLAYYGVFSPKVTGKSGFTNLDLSSWNLKANGDLVFKVQNRQAEEVTVTKVYAGDAVVDVTDVKVSAGATSDFITASFAGLSGTSGSQYNLGSVALEYTIGTTAFNSTGTLSGQRS